MQQIFDFVRHRNVNDCGSISRLSCALERFTTLDQLSTRIKQLIEELTPEQVVSVTSYDFILEALFYTAL